MLAQMRGSRPALLLAAAALLLLVVIATRGESPVPTNVADLPLKRGFGGLTLDGPSAPGLGMPSDFADSARLFGMIIAVLAGLLLVAALVIAILSARRSRRRLGVGQVVETVEGTVDTTMHLRLKHAVTSARDTLARAGGAPGDAVVAAWLTLENATSTAREPHQTATEFTTALLERETGQDEPALLDLRTRYQRARFGDGATEEDARAAVAALDRILAAMNSERAR